MPAEPTFAVVVTTIGDGSFLDRYAAAVDDSLRARVSIVVVPDRKTPAAIYAKAAELRAAGLRVDCPDLGEQEAALARWGSPSMIPYDSDNRRNVGYLLAWAAGADVVVSVDDDNLPTSPAFFSSHAVVAGGPATATEVSSPTGWFNCCDLLEVQPLPVYPRGYPYRHRRPAELTSTTATVPVAVNAGLWLGDPDVDAATRVTVAPESVAPRGEPVVLAADTWCPVNSQNTALRREALPAYYFLRMGYRLEAGVVDRFGDIFSGLFVQACAKHLGQAVRFGDPYVEHARNPHHLLDDLAVELPAVVLLEDVADWLRECKLEGGGYPAAYLSLSHALEEAVEGFEGRWWTHAARGFFHQMAHLMRAWLTMVDRAGADA